MAFFVVTFSTTSFAVTLQHQFASPITGEYETNPQMSSSDEKSVTRKVVTPSYGISAIDGRNTWFSDLAVRVERSSDQEVSINREDPTLNMGWEHELDRGIFTLTGRYDEKSTRVSELEDTGQIFSDGTRKSQSLSSTYQESINERMALTFNAQYDSISYSGGDLTDYNAPSANVSFNYLWSERFEPFIQLSISRYEPSKDLVDTSFYSGDIGFNWIVSQQFDLSSQLGTNHISGGSSDTDWQGLINATYTKNLTETSIELSRSLSPSGSGGYLKSERIKFDWQYDINENITTGLNINFIKNQSETLTFGAWYKYELTRSWFMKLNAEHREREEAGSRTVTTTNQLISATLEYNFSNI